VVVVSLAVLVKRLATLLASRLASVVRLWHSRACLGDPRLPLLERDSRRARVSAAFSRDRFPGLRFIDQDRFYVIRGAGTISTILI